MNAIALPRTNSNYKWLQDIFFLKKLSKLHFLEISGYVRTKLAMVHTRWSGLTTYGIGAITDGTKKITVQVKHYQDLNAKYEMGDFVTVRGTIKEQGSLITVCCNSVDDIHIESDKERLTPDKLKNGCRAVKRALPHD